MTSCELMGGALKGSIRRVAGLEFRTACLQEWNVDVKWLIADRLTPVG